MNVFYIAFLSVFIYNFSWAALITELHQPLTLKDQCIRYLLFTRHKIEPDIEILPLDIQDAIEIKSQEFLSELLKNPITDIKIKQFMGLLNNGFLLNLELPIISSLVQHWNVKGEATQDHLHLYQLLARIFATKKYDKNNAHLAVKIAVNREAKCDNIIFFDIALYIINHALHNNLSDCQLDLNNTFLCNRKPANFLPFFTKIIPYNLPQSLKDKTLSYCVHQYVNHANNEYGPTIKALIENQADTNLLSSYYKKILKITQ